jgi:hypothetical protein
LANRWRIFVVFVLALAVLTAGAAMFRPSATPPSDPFRRTVSACSSGQVSAERACYSRALHARLSGDGARAALALLDRLAALDPHVRRDGHMYAHGIGIAALTDPRQVGRIFASCTPAWQSGCYHGVLQGYFLAVGRAGGVIDRRSLDALCQDYRGPRGDRWLLFQCTHGIGHGLTMYRDHDLPRALAGCDLISRPEEQESCYGGAFMENIVNFTHPHQMAEMPGMGSMHGGHSSLAAGGGWRPLDPNDLHYPCSVLPQRYLEACYTNQTTAMLFYTRQDVGRTSAECLKAPERVRRTCFISLGRDVSTIGRDFTAMIRLCARVATEFQPVCNEGVAESVVNMNADPAAGIAYCRAIPAWRIKAACYDVVGRQASAMVDGAARRADACRRGEPGFIDVCLGEPPPSTRFELTVTARRGG